MRRTCLILFLVALSLNSACLPGEVLASLLPTADLPVAATLEYPNIGTLDTSAFTMQAAIVGTVVDQYGSAISGVVICYGPDEDDATAIAVTDAAGAYSGTTPHSFGGASGNQIWAYLPLYRFEPDRVQVSGTLMTATTLDFKAYPSVYPVPPERDCR